MLTKNLTFDNDVLSVLRNMRWNETGTLCIITSGQLPRDLYEKVDKALTAMGGKWNRKQGGHVFQTDPRQSVEGLLENGTLKVERDGFFETPRAVVDRMLELVEPVGVILEPSAGLGAIADNLPVVSKDQVVCIEKNIQRAEILSKKGYFTMCGDFLECPFDINPDTIYMNPPFEEGQDIDHVMHAYDILAPGGQMVSVMSEGPFFRKDRKAVQFYAWLEEVNGYSEKLPPDSFRDSGTGVNARLVVIRKEPNAARAMRKLHAAVRITVGQAVLRDPTLGNIRDWISALNQYEKRDGGVWELDSIVRASVKKANAVREVVQCAITAADWYANNCTERIEPLVSLVVAVDAMNPVYRSLYTKGN